MYRVFQRSSPLKLFEIMFTLVESFCMKFCKFVGMCIRGKVNAIWWNIKINLQKLVDIRGYELPINLQNFTLKRVNQRENIPNGFRGTTFLKHPVYHDVERGSVYQTIQFFNPLMDTWNYSVISNNMQLIHWPLMGGLLRLVQAVTLYQM